MNFLFPKSNCINCRAVAKDRVVWFRFSFLFSFSIFSVLDSCFGSQNGVIWILGLLIWLRITIVLVLRMFAQTCFDLAWVRGVVAGNYSVWGTVVKLVYCSDSFFFFLGASGSFFFPCSFHFSLKHCRAYWVSSPLPLLLFRLMLSECLNLVCLPFVDSWVVESWISVRCILGLIKTLIEGTMHMDIVISSYFFLFKVIGHSCSSNYLEAVCAY